jgi:hypothetical protein
VDWKNAGEEKEGKRNRTEKMRIQVATCQFPVGANIRENARHILRLMNTAKDRGADVAHFPEAGLSGYARSEFVSYKGFDWESLKNCIREILAESNDLRLSVILGSTHPLAGNHKPHNSLYVINDKGEIVERYDKMFCSGDFKEKTGDLTTILLETILQHLRLRAYVAARSYATILDIPNSIANTNVETFNLYSILIMRATYL